MDQRCYITWTTLPPSVIRFDPSQSHFFGYGIVSSLEKASNHHDVNSIAQCLIANEVMPVNNVLTFHSNSIEFSESYTSAKLARAFKFQASNVESEGIFIFYYSGPCYNLDNQNCSLGSSNFDPRDQTTHITADSVTSWLKESACKAKLVLVFLSCPRGAAMAGRLTDPAWDSRTRLNLCVLATNEDPPTLLKPPPPQSGTASVTCRFLCAEIARARVGRGLLQVTSVCERTVQCCEEFFKLIVTYNPAGEGGPGNKLQTHESQSKFLALGKPRVVGTEISSRDEIDGPLPGPLPPPPGDMPFLGKYFRPGMKGGALLPSYSYDWLQWAGNEEAGPLSALFRLGVLYDDAALRAVVCAMTQALASIQIAFTPSDVDNPNAVLVCFTSVAAMLSSVARGSVDLTEEHFVLSWGSYCETAERGGVAVPVVRVMLTQACSAA